MMLRKISAVLFGLVFLMMLPWMLASVREVSPCEKVQTFTKPFEYAAQFSLWLLRGVTDHTLDERVRRAQAFRAWMSDHIVSPVFYGASSENSLCERDPVLVLRALGWLDEDGLLTPKGLRYLQWWQSSAPSAAGDAAAVVPEKTAPAISKSQNDLPRLPLLKSVPPERAHPAAIAPKPDFAQPQPLEQAEEAPKGWARPGWLLGAIVLLVAVFLLVSQGFRQAFGNWLAKFLATAAETVKHLTVSRSTLMPDVDKKRTDNTE